MITLSKGANMPLHGARVSIVIQAAEPVDLSAALLGADHHVRSDGDFIFYNQPHARGCRLDVSAATMTLDLSDVEQAVASIAVLASLDGTRSATFGQVGAGTRALVHVDGGLAAEFVPTQLGPESALQLVEVYRRNGGWKLRAVSQGWSDGLAGLARSFGVVVDDEAPPAASAAPPRSSLPPRPIFPTVTAAVPPASPVPRVSPVPPAATPAPPSLQKVVLTKQGDSRSVTLLKSAKASANKLHFNLNWAQPRFGRGVDLDLGCFAEMRDGGQTVIQPLGRSFGYVTKWPWIKLDRDDRTGGHGSGENLTIHRPEEIKRVLVFAMIYAGTTDFGSVKGELTITDAHGGQTYVRLDNPGARRSWCAIAMITNDSQDVRIAKEERYFRNHQEADRHYGFGFNWTPGRKRGTG
jgi:tellurite resistance protein TerA